MVYKETKMQQLQSVPKGTTSYLLPTEIKVVRITPHMAGLWLKHNDVNRRLDLKRVRKFAREMQGGRWQLHPEGMICIATDGSLLNGQHRLTAVVQAGIPVDMYVATGVDPEAQIVMDKGRPRKVSDNLHMFHDVPRQYANKTAVIARYVLTFEMGIWDTPNEADALDIWQRYGEAITWLYEQAEDIPWNRGAYYASPIVFAYKQDPDLIKEFHTGLATCRPHADNTPQATLYRNLSSPKLRTGGMKGFEMSLRVFNALSSYFEEGTIQRLYVSTVGYDRLKKRWGMVSRRSKDGNCTWTNCPCDPSDKGLCWVHKNYGANKKPNAASDSDE